MSETRKMNETRETRSATLTDDEQVIWIEETLRELTRLIRRRTALVARWPELIALRDYYVTSILKSSTLGFINHTRQLNAALEQTITQLNTRAPLKTLLLGGSGVGKSTLLNALARREVSQPSHTTRAHTSGLVIYTHTAWREIPLITLTPSWSRELCAQSIRVEHEAEALRDVWVIDAPDVDSSELIHRARTLEALREVDLPLIITSPEKYRDRSYLSALSRIDARRRVIFVMTSLDRIWPEQRVELMRDATQLIIERGFTRALWVVLDARTDSVTELDPLSSDQISFTEPRVGLEALREILECDLDTHEAARIRAGRFTQQLHHLTTNLEVSALSNVVQATKDLYLWRESTRASLTPRFKTLFTCKHIQRELHARSVMRLLHVTSPISPQLDKDVSLHVGADWAVRLTVWISTPLRLCWGLLLNLTKEQSAHRLAATEVRIARRVALLTLRQRWEAMPSSLTEALTETLMTETLMTETLMTETLMTETLMTETLMTETLTETRQETRQESQTTSSTSGSLAAGSLASGSPSTLPETLMATPRHDVLVEASLTRALKVALDVSLDASLNASNALNPAMLSLSLTEFIIFSVIQLGLSSGFTGLLVASQSIPLNLWSISLVWIFSSICISRLLLRRVLTRYDRTQLVAPNHHQSALKAMQEFEAHLSAHPYWNLLDQFKTRHELDLSVRDVHHYHDAHQRALERINTRCQERL